eukprot:580367-Pelagomonas_calceolata.AAC.1
MSLPCIYICTRAAWQRKVRLYYWKITKGIFRRVQGSEGSAKQDILRCQFHGGKACPRGPLLTP